MKPVWCHGKSEIRLSCALYSAEFPGRPIVTKMVVKEELSLFPSSVKSLPGVREGNVPIKRSFHWLLIATLALMFGWLVLLSVRSYQPALSEEMVSSLMRGQEVFQILIEPNPTRIFFKSQQPN